MTDMQHPEEVNDLPQNNPSPLRSVFEWVEMFAVYFSVGVLLFIMFIRHCPVVGDSMMHTLNNGDLMIITTFGYTPENGDVIVCQSAEYGLDKPLVKRVIATGGQTVCIDYEDWKVTVDGVPLEEDYVWLREGVDMLRSDYLDTEFTVPEGYLFVMGDNRNDSKDSRSSEIGFIDTRYVVGKLSIRLLPFEEFRIFD
ncbi:MAG: signal peptidase I [Clostridia bacterium]|nr:signal peptidase I [Clostridia bacterium]